LLFGVISVASSAAYFPLRFLCLRLIGDLSRAGDRSVGSGEKSDGAFASPLPYLFEVLESAELSRRPSMQKQSSLTATRSMELSIMLRVAKGKLRSIAYQQAVFQQVQYLLLSHFAQQAYHVAYPELVVPALVFLKRYSKRCKNTDRRNAIHQLIEKLQQQSDWLLRKRSGPAGDFAPNDLQRIAKFLEKEKAAGEAPLDKYFKDFAERQAKQLQMTLASMETEPQVSDEEDDEDGGDEEDGDAVEDEDESLEDRRTKQKTKQPVPTQQKKQSTNLTVPAKKQKSLPANGADLVEELQLSDDE